MVARPALRRAIPSSRTLLHAESRILRSSFSTTLQLQQKPNNNNNNNNSVPEYAIPDPARPTHFGFETVTEAEKRERVAGVFTSVAESYDRMNDLMSFGWHRVWKDHFVASLNPGFSPLTSSSDPRAPQHILDIAGGTGDIAFRMLHTAHILNGNPDVRVTISDINPAMLSVGKQRSASLPASQQAALSFLEANAEDLTQTKPLGANQVGYSPTTGVPDESVDLYTVAFGIRNFSNIPAALREAYRVLKPGGVFACLEFSKADKHPLFNTIYKQWSFSAIPLIGQLVAGDRDSYQYLVESIERFPSQEDFRDMIVDAGFVVGGQGYEDLTGGVAAIHKGMKPRRK
ncbi:ubiquinone biosynthesis methyltransferase coq5 [Neurospora hispaniola]|uniref:2-methoxy-6-polyprenyl-1,4-benzoquinol methylase, mitochondrial n=1 Tax=Neurospora hispaniola TaxID=588809 RepID=A0AAJ0I7U2_9PEZI|nr:ubiquinone biosynthesis methyltransferase coq5 [Neurospora hispaniola]